MTGRACFPVWRLASLIATIALAGCDPDAPAPRAPLSQVAASSDFDPTKTGEIAGRVIWTGDLPEVPPFVAPVSPLSEQLRGEKRHWPNPNAPLIDPKNRGIGDAVVFLRGVDPRRARPWDLDLVRVEARDYQIHVRQGISDGRCGFVRRGAKIDVESKQDVFHSLRARGAAFFSLTLPEEGTTRERVLDRNGVVDLSSGAGQFWMRAYLFVDDHPYYALTASDGRFTLPQAPAGDYELVCWMPDWREADHEIDAETRLITRLDFRPPLQMARPIHIEAGATTTANFSLSLEDFGSVKHSSP